MFDGIFKQGVQFHDLRVNLDVARRWSERLFERFPTDDSWQNEKRRALHLTAQGLAGSRNTPMTVDWWIALSIEDAPDAYAVTADTGPEWSALRDDARVLSLSDAMTWLEALPDRP